MSLLEWSELVHRVNGRETVGMVGIRDPEYPCEEFDGRGYQGDGWCSSDGHYLCTECSHLSPESERFTEHGRDGRRDRLRLFWARNARRPA